VRHLIALKVPIFVNSLPDSIRVLPCECVCVSLDGELAIFGKFIFTGSVIFVDPSSNVINPTSRLSD
jgi:hypothetical protein